MPTYDYRCEANGRVVEVVHRLSEPLKTWGELCTKAGIDPGDTPLDSTVVRMATGGNVIAGGLKAERGPAPACATGSCCPGGFCGLN